MNILFLADNFPPEKNAQASRVYERAVHWVEWGHQVTVITCAPNFPEGKVYPGYRNRWYQTEEIAGIRVVRVKTFVAANKGAVLRIIDFLSYMITAFVAGLFQRQPDVVVATSPQFFAAVAGWALSRCRRRPFVFELSDLWPDSIVAVGAMRASLPIHLLEKFELFLYRQSAEVVALTNAFKQNLVRRGIPAGKISVVTNGVDLSRFSPRPRDQQLAAEWGIGPDDFVVAYIGTLGMAHGLDNVLDTAQATSNPRVKFLLVGPGAERDSLIGEAKQRNLSNVIFVPPQPKERMPAFWSLAHVALVHLKNTPLFSTVIPSKIFEAMGMGRPILLVSPKGEAFDIVVSEKVGLWVPPADPSALAEAIEKFASDPEFLRKIASNSAEAAASHSRERQAREMLASLQHAVSPSRPRKATQLSPAAPAAAKAASAGTSGHSTPTCP